MAGFLYYLPEGMTVDQFISERADLWPDKPSLARNSLMGSGPDGTKGTVLVMEHASKPRCAYLPEVQVWQKAPRKTWWLGVEKERLPTAADLSRPEQHAGHAVPLESGGDWLIPKVRVWLNEDGQTRYANAFGAALRLDADGKVTAAPLARYQWLIDQTRRIWEAMAGASGEVASIALDDEWRIGVEALRLNYYVGPEEVSFLGLLSTEALLRIFRALVDLPGLQEMLKSIGGPDSKNAASGVGGISNTGHGETG